MRAKVLDCIISGGLIVDGSGSVGYQGDVGIANDKIAKLGQVNEQAKDRIDATGLVVAPGFVDIHTHYDAQVFWDRTLSPSALHGVTTAVAGNCGFTIAPTAPEHADYLRKMLANVEGMPLESLESGVPWGDWSSVAEYLELIEDSTSINVGFLAGHSAIRRMAMGDQAQDPHPSDRALQQMEVLLRESLAAGALGFSSSNGANHLDGSGDPVPSRNAEDDEMLRLCRIVREFPGTSLEYVPRSAQEEAERMIAMSLTADRALNWNLLLPSVARKARASGDMAVSEKAAQRGARVYALTAPLTIRPRRSFWSGFSLSAIPEWGPIFKLSAGERIAALRDPSVRQRLHESGLTMTAKRPELVDWENYVVEGTASETNEPLQGMRVGDIARARSASPFDTLLDIVVADQLKTVLMGAPIADDPESQRLQAEAWTNPWVVLGGSDAGAHLDMLSAFTYFTEMLGLAVRERGLITLEDAVHLLADKPARLYGLKGRGRISEGNFADLVLFDPDRIAPQPVTTRYDLPGSAGRLYAGAEGIEYVINNGQTIVQRNAYTGARPGVLIRAGSDR